MNVIIHFFFFSSRRRHTRWPRDWSSDVCSSDLVRNVITAKNKKRATIRFIYRNVFLKLPVKQNLVYFESFGGKSYSDSPKYIYEHLINHEDGYKYVWNLNKIGRASCRERV